MKIIMKDDADAREQREKLKNTAKQAGSLINRQESIITQMQKLMIESGVPAVQIQHMNPVQWCHECLSEWAINELV